MGVYDRQVATAKRLIKAKGQLVTWVKHTVTIDPAKPWKTTAAGSPPTFPVSIAFFPMGTLANAFTTLMRGTSVPDGSQEGLMAQVPFTPEINDVVLRGTQNLVIKSIDPLAPNGEQILYTLTFA